MTLGTVREFRRTGLGSLLVERVVDMINTTPECGALYLHVITYNEGAMKLYEKLGFAFVKEIKGETLLGGGVIVVTFIVTLVIISLHLR